MRFLGTPGGPCPRPAAISIAGEAICKGMGEGAGAPEVIGWLCCCGCCSGGCWYDSKPGWVP
eukprot:scaffold260995_cov10-Tisochrysis_lutea.AAC.1